METAKEFMETAKRYISPLTKANFKSGIKTKLNEDTVPEIMVSFTKERVTEILTRMGVDPLEIYWELENIV